MSNAIAARIGERILNAPQFLTPATLIATAAGSYDRFGKFVEGATTETAVQLVTAPISGRDRQVLPEGLRSLNVRKFWLREAVTAVVEGEQAGDVIRYDGADYRAVMVEDWGGFQEVTGVEGQLEPAG